MVIAVPSHVSLDCPWMQQFRQLTVLQPRMLSTWICYCLMPLCMRNPQSQHSLANSKILLDHSPVETFVSPTWKQKLNWTLELYNSVLHPDSPTSTCCLSATWKNTCSRCTTSELIFLVPSFHFLPELPSHVRRNREVQQGRWGRTRRTKENQRNKKSQRETPRNKERRHNTNLRPHNRKKKESQRQISARYLNKLSPQKRSKNKSFFILVIMHLCTLLRDLLPAISICGSSRRVISSTTSPTISNLICSCLWTLLTRTEVFFALEASPHDLLRNKSPRIVANVCNHQLTITEILPKDWKTKDYSCEFVVDPLAEEQIVSSDYEGEEDLLSTKLSKDIHILILQFCTARDVCRVASCSKYWNTVANNDSIWKILCIKIFPSVEKIMLRNKELAKELREATLHPWGGSMTKEEAEEFNREEEEQQKKQKEETVTWKQEYIVRFSQFKIEKQRVVDLHKARMHHRYWMMCGVHMFHPVNGRTGFDSLPPPKFPPGMSKPSVEKLKEMLKRENDLRLSTEVQSKFADPSFDAISIAADVQERVVCEFGYCGTSEMTKLGLEIIRSAPLLYPEDQDLRNIPHYVKYNRSRRGEMEPGDSIPDAFLANLSSSPITLFECLDSVCSSKKNNKTEDTNNAGTVAVAMMKQQKTKDIVLIACGSYT